MRTSALVLAAGRSARMGRPKQLLPVLGEPLLRLAIEPVASCPRIAEVVVVLGHGAEEIRSILPAGPRVRAIVNERYTEGIGSSLAAGLGALGAETQAAVVVLGDQVGITPAAVEAVIEAHERTGRPCVRVLYCGGAGAGVPGHPVLLARHVWPELLELRGDEGARALLRRHPDWVHEVPLDADAPVDVDTPADYERLLRARDRGGPTRDS